MKKFANLYLALVFVILYLPIFYLIAYSFNSGGDMNSFTGFTLDNYQSMFSDSRLMLILAQTFFLAFLSALLATIIGTFGSIFIYESKQKQQTGILSLNNVLMVAPDLDWFPIRLCICLIESHCFFNPNCGSHGVATSQGNESRYGECRL